MLLNETVPQWVIDITVDVSVSYPAIIPLSVHEMDLKNAFDRLLTAFLFCYRKACQNSTRSLSTSNLIHHLGPKHSKSMLCL